MGLEGWEEEWIIETNVDTSSCLKHLDGIYPFQRGAGGNWAAVPSLHHLIQADVMDLFSIWWGNRLRLGSLPRTSKLCQLCQGPRVDCLMLLWGWRLGPRAGWEDFVG